MDYSREFLSGAIYCREFGEATDIVKRNSSGNIWLIGGFVFRTLANQLYGVQKPLVDLDYIVENSVSNFDLPCGLKIKHNRFGNYKFVRGNFCIDYVPLSTIYSITKRQVAPTIENYLSGVPFNIQSIAFDVYNNKIIGDVGIDALQRKVVEVNDLEFAEYAAKRKNKSIHEMIQEKANSLGFTPIFPY